LIDLTYLVYTQETSLLDQDDATSKTLLFSYATIEISRMPKSQKRGLRQYEMLRVGKSDLGLLAFQSRVRDDRYWMKEFLWGNTVWSLGLLRGDGLLLLLGYCEVAVGPDVRT
jgi:hypothetical protein